MSKYCVLQELDKRVILARIHGYYMPLTVYFMQGMDFTREVVAAFAFNANPQSAVPMKAYMKNKFEYFGIPSPLRKEISKPFLLKNSLPKQDEVPAILGEFWSQNQRELQYFGLDLLQKFSNSAPPEWIILYEQLISSKSWWDTVDGLAAWQVGDLFARYPELILPNTHNWMNSGNLWLQRTCLIFQLRYKEKTDFDLLKSFIIPLAAHKDFFIRKAVGWALRQYGKYNPEAVLAFVVDQPLSNLSYREATKLLK